MPGSDFGMLPQVRLIDHWKRLPFRADVVIDYRIASRTLQATLNFGKPHTTTTLCFLELRGYRGAMIEKQPWTISYDLLDGPSGWMRSI